MEMAGKYEFFRLNPRLNARDGATSIFTLAKAVDCTLVTGDRWGDDYLAVETGKVDVDLVLELMKEEGIFFEKIERLPPHVAWQIY